MTLPWYDRQSVAASGEACRLNHRRLQTLTTQTAAAASRGNAAAAAV